MTDEAIRLAVAEIDGWMLDAPPHFDHDGRWHILPYRRGDKPLFGSEEDEHWAGKPTNPILEINWIPNYPTDLNSIHAAMHKAGPTVIKAMRFYLYEICDQMTAHAATALQYCEAFLKATNHWKD